MMASHTGQVEVVRLLFSQPNIDLEKDFDGLTALGIANENNHDEIGQLLKDAGAEFVKGETKAAATTDGTVETTS